MFTMEEVLKLMKLLDVSLMCPGTFSSSYRLSQSKLSIEDLQAHYNSYLAASKISVYNPVSICSALDQGQISDYWVSSGLFQLSLSCQVTYYVIGEHPLIRRHLDSLEDETSQSFADLLACKEISVELSDNVIIDKCV